MKKLFLTLGVLLSCLALTGCALTRSSAKDAVKLFLDQYKNLSTGVLTDLENVIDEEDFTNNQEETYRDILKKQYSDLKYEIVEEKYDGDTATVEAKITVYDLYKAQNDAAAYLNDHQDEFKDEDGIYDNNKFLDYKLEQMKKMNDTVEYTITFDVVKNEDGKWQVKELTDDDLEKIHGVYNYDNQ